MEKNSNINKGNISKYENDTNRDDVCSKKMDYLFELKEYQKRTGKSENEFIKELQKEDLLKTYH